MFKVLLADDEPMALEALRLAADWEESGFFICGECRNGLEALEAVEKLHPDLVVTDIRMPDVDGLELIRRVSKNHPSVRFIIVSGYDDFEYAKNALLSGVNHYVLKPVFKDEFTDILSRIHRQLKQLSRLKETEEKETDTNIFFDMLFNADSAGAVNRLRPDGALKGYHVWLYAALDIRNGMFPDDLKAKLAGAETPQTCIYLAPRHRSLQGLVLGGRNKTALDELLGMLVPRIRTILENCFYLAAGSPVERLADIRRSRSEAEEAMTYRFFRTAGAVLHFDEIKDLYIDYTFDGRDKMDGFIDAFESMDQESLLQTAEEVFGNFRKRLAAPEIVEMYVINVIYKSFSAIESMGGSAGSLAGESGISKLYGAGLSLDELYGRMCFYIRTFCRYAQDLRHRSLEPDKRKVSEYMLQNYKKGITIREISRVLYIHPAYLGRQISKWFGCGFNEYLHRLRIEEGKRLLRETDLKLHEIAADLGYSTYNSFLQQFVRHTHVKPNEYRNNIRK